MVSNWDSHLARVGAAVLLLGVLGGSVGAVPAAQFQGAFEQFSLARAGDEAAIDKSIQIFAALHQGEPTNPVLLAYLGAGTAMQANTTYLPWKKMGYAEDGLALLDKALTMLTPVHNNPVQHQVPGVLEVRLVAANTFLAVPGFMNRSARGAKLLGEVLGSPLLASAPLVFRADVWLAAARLAIREQRPDDARKYLDWVVKADAPQAAAARAQLKALAS
jgi:hypothetical protein